MTVLTCLESYSYYDSSGNQAFVQEGDTLNDDNPIIRGHESKFAPFEVTHQTTAVEPKKGRRI